MKIYKTSYAEFVECGRALDGYGLSRFKNNFVAENGVIYVVSLEEL